MLIADGLARFDATSLARMQNRKPDRIAVSNAVDRSTPRQWRHAVRTLDAFAPVWPVVGRGERRRDARLRGFFAAWPNVGIPVLSEPVSWYAVDVQTNDVRWRWVVCDSDAGALGRAWLDERSWLPKAVSDDRVDRLIVALNGAATGTEPLLELLRNHASADKVILAIAYGTGTPEFVTRGGRWGEGRLHPSPLPAGGWWTIDLEASGLTITAERPLGQPVLHNWTPGTGWVMNQLATKGEG